MLSSVTFLGLNTLMRRFRSTKIVATLGPSSNSRDSIRDLIRAGVDVFRFNFSHGSLEDHAERFRVVREVEAELDHPVAVMADLQGPKLRVGTFAVRSIELEEGATFRLDMDEVPGDANGFVCRTKRFRCDGRRH